MSNFVTRPEKEKVMDLFVYFFKEVKGHDEYTDEEIMWSRNEEDYKDFLEWVKTGIYEYDKD